MNLQIDEGELCLVVGRTGVGKSTLLGAINGLVPHFTGGTLAGRVSVAGRDTEHNPPRELAELVGVVGQDPLAGFVTDTVEDELAYGMEQLAVSPSVMRQRVEEILDLLALAELRNRPLLTLSGGQQQRVAIGAVMTAHPRVLVLDEPTSALDPIAAEDVLAAITRIVHDLGVTVVLAEHRLERVVQYADRVVYLPGDGTVFDGPPATILADSSVAPPIVELGRLAGWTPLPLSIRDARRSAGPMRQRLGGRAVPPARPWRPEIARVVLDARGVTVRYGTFTAVAGVDLRLRAGEVTALMGRNGSGKSSLLWALQGSGPRAGGRVEVDGPVTLVPQTPGDLLYLDSVAAELTESGAERESLDRLAPGIEDATHPRDLSEGQRLALVLAIALREAPAVVLLDEPTRGLDYEGKRALTSMLDQLTAAGRAVLIATHDVEFAAVAADRALVLADGELLADGPAADVLGASPAFAPQVAKILAPLAYLTVGQVAAAQDGAP